MEANSGGDEGEFSDEVNLLIFQRSRYVLIHVLPDGTPNAVQPVSSLDEARSKVQVLMESEDGGWQIFDLEENRKVESARA
jgi:hypothetical protein